MTAHLVRCLYDTAHMLLQRNCPICHQRLLRNEGRVCMTCLNRLTRIEHNNPDLRPYFEQGFYWQRTFVRAACHFYFTENMRTLVHAFKYHHKGTLARQLGRQAALELAPSGFFDHIDLLVPIPLHWKRCLGRGYNQSKKIAEGIHSVTGIPVNTKLMVRQRNNPTQTHLKRDERVKNVDGIFRLTPTAYELGQKHILLIDDVFTTGATLNEGLEELSKIQNVKISVFALCYASETPILQFKEECEFCHEFTMDGAPS